MKRESLTSSFIELGNLYKDRKTHDFVTHLVWNYYPVNIRVRAVIDWDDLSDRERQCAVTGRKVYSLNELKTHLDKRILNLPLSANWHLGDTIPKMTFHPLTTPLKDDKYLGFTAKGTTTVLSLTGVHALEAFIMDSIFKRNKEIYAIIKKSNEKYFEDSIPAINNKSEIKKFIRKEFFYF